MKTVFKKLVLTTIPFLLMGCSTAPTENKNNENGNGTNEQGKEEGKEQGNEQGNTHTHEWSTEWEKDASYHWHKCASCNEKNDNAAHDWNEWQTTNLGTMLNDARYNLNYVKTRTCKVCGFEELDKDWCEGLSFLGGEPMSYFSDNRKQVISFAKEVKEKYPNKDIWLWSGYTFEEIVSNDETKEILNYIDVLVDGPFVESLKNLGLKWKGSENQRVLDIKNYRNTGVLKEVE